MADVALRCPQCGAQARPDEADAFATCGFCGARLFLGAEPGVRHEYLLAAIKPGEVPARLGKWLEDREALGAAQEISSRVVFMPFWVHTSRQGDALAPAAPLLSDGLTSFRLPAGDSKSFSPAIAGLGAVVPVSVVRESVPFGGAPASEVRLVHVPFHETSFRLFGRSVRVLLDAVAGQVLALDAVRTSEARLDRIYALLLAVLFALAFTGLHALFRGVWIRGLLFAGIAGPLLVLITRQVVVKMEET